MIHIVGVHGVGAYRPGPPGVIARQIATAWKGALDSSDHVPWEPTEYDLAMSYYGPLLRPAEDRDIELDPDDDDPALQELLIGFLKSVLPDPEDVKGSWLPREVAAAIAGVFGHDEATAWAFLRVFFPEVAIYLSAEGDFTPHDEIKSKVGADLAGADIVIAHSLGSVIAYEALWQFPTDLPLLITIGSPLAMPIIFPHLTPPPVDGRGAKPPCVQRWINIADHGDVVASPRWGVGDQFKGVDRDVEDDIDEVFFHDEEGYLRSRQMGRALADWNLPLAHV